MINSIESPSHGLAFAHPDRLLMLRRRGYFTLMDATLNMNYLKWYLTTLMVRTEYASWIPVAHFLHQFQDSDIIATGLRKIKEWCGNQWLLRYILTDDSAGEQCAVRKAFPGLIAGEQEVTHILCTVHSERTMRRTLAGSRYEEVRKHLLVAMRVRRTQAGCMESVRAAIKASPKEKTAYIEKEWLATCSQWAMYARQHSSLLIQVGQENLTMYLH